MKKLLCIALFAALAANSYQVEAARPRSLPHGARICRVCGGDGRVRCGFLHLDSKRCLDCDGRGFVLLPPPRAPHPVVRPHGVPPKPVIHRPMPPKRPVPPKVVPVPPKSPVPPKAMPVPPKKGGKVPR